MSDVESLMLIFSDPIAMKYYPSTFTREQAHNWTVAIDRCWEQHGFGQMAWPLKDDDSFVGECGYFFQADVDGRDEVEIGYMFARKYWNKGLATEAATVCKEYAFHSLGLQRVISLVEPENVASKRVAEKVGMHVEKSLQRWGKEHLLYIVEEFNEGLV